MTRILVAPLDSYVNTIEHFAFSKPILRVIRSLLSQNTALKS